jgi:hypothetical protein
MKKPPKKPRSRAENFLAMCRDVPRPSDLEVRLASSVVSVQNDTDAIFFRNGTLYGIDMAIANNRLDLFILSLTTGADIDVAAATYASGQVPLRIAYDESRKKAFGWRASDRNLVEINLESGAAPSCP